MKTIWSTGPSSISAYAAANSTIVGQPRPSRRAVSRTSSAPPPYNGASTSTEAYCEIGMLPSRNSPTVGASSTRPRAIAMRCLPGVTIRAS